MNEQLKEAVERLKELIHTTNVDLADRKRKKQPPEIIEIVEGRLNCFITMNNLANLVLSIGLENVLKLKKND